MQKNQFWYEKQDAETQEKLRKIMHQKEIYRDAIEKRSLQHDQNNDKRDHNPLAFRKLFK